MHDCQVTASDNARLFHIYVNEKAVTWIQSGLRKCVKTYIDVELRAMSHIASKLDDDQMHSMHNMRAGVRDKIHWMPEARKWSLKFKGSTGDDTSYCKVNGISLSVPNDSDDAHFNVAREEAFRNACSVWNAIDDSGRRRIRMPNRPLKVQMRPVPVSKTKAMSHSGSDAESDLDSPSQDEDQE